MTSVAQTRVRVPVVLLTMLSGAAVIVSSFVTWINGRGDRPSTGVSHTSVAELFQWTWRNNVGFGTSVGLVLLVLGILVVIGAIVGSRVAVLVAALLAFVISFMWGARMISYYNDAGLWPVRSWGDLRQGAYLGIVGAIVGVLSSFWLRGRPRSV